MTTLRFIQFTLSLALCGAVGVSAWGIEQGRLDAFLCETPECDSFFDTEFNGYDSGIIDGWKQGPSKIDFPGGMDRLVHGGPAGVGDHFLQITSYQRFDGVTDPHTKLVVNNQGAWTGNYLQAGVLEIVADMINFGGTNTPTNPPAPESTDFDTHTANDLNIRILLESAGGGWRVFSKVGVPLAVGSGWQKVSFLLNPEDLIGPPVDGLSGETLSTATLQNSARFRFFHSDIADEDINDSLIDVFPPSPLGFSGVLGMDNIYARLAGDFDLDVDEDVDDVDLLSNAIQNGGGDFAYRFDLNADELVDADDGRAFLAIDRINTVAGDFDLNGAVGVPDLITWAKNFGAGEVYSQGDADFNGAVGVPDLITWAKAFGFSNQTEPISSINAAVAIPEPGGLALLGAMIIAVFNRRQPGDGERV
jgi:hypothetical protein